MYCSFVITRERVSTLSRGGASFEAWGLPKETWGQTKELEIILGKKRLRTKDASHILHEAQL
jgi:hypothetical protein